MWVNVKRRYDHWQSPRRLVTFMPGDQSVKKEVGEHLIKEGVADEIPAPPSPNAEGGEVTNAEGAEGGRKPRK